MSDPALPNYTQAARDPEVQSRFLGDKIVIRHDEKSSGGEVSFRVSYTFGELIGITVHGITVKSLTDGKVVDIENDLILALFSVRQVTT